MKVGDLVEYEGKRFKVIKRDKSLRVCTLLNWDGDTVEVPDDMNELVVCHPSDTWPFVALPRRRKGGLLRQVLRNGEPLRPMWEWVPSDMLRYGGSVFFHPELTLRTGEVLVGVHEDGKRSRISITRSFGTVRLRVARSRPIEKVRPTAYDRLLADPFGGDD